jgi:hypothetical protein
MQMDICRQLVWTHTQVWSPKHEDLEMFKLAIINSSYCHMASCDAFYNSHAEATENTADSKVITSIRLCHAFVASLPMITVGSPGHQVLQHDLSRQSVGMLL